MSIRIVPKEQLGKEPSEKSISFIPPVLFPNLKNLYQRRAERFQALAKDNPFADYLEFAAEIAFKHSPAATLKKHFFRGKIIQQLIDVIERSFRCQELTGGNIQE